MTEMTKVNNPDATSLSEEERSKQFVRVYGLLEKEPRLVSLIHSPRLAKAAQDLEGMADGVRMYQAQSFFKEPGDMGSSFHSDNYACPLDTNNQLTTAWLPLVDTDRDMGMLAFARGSHADMNLNFWNNGKAMGGNHRTDAEAASGEYGVYHPEYIKSRFYTDTWPNLKPGDVTFHNGWTLHASYPNVKPEDSGAVREATAISYVPDAVRTLPNNKFESQYAVDDRLNGVNAKIRQMDIPPNSPIPDDILHRVWPPL